MTFLALVTASVVDVMIAASLCFSLGKLRTGVERQVFFIIQEFSIQWFYIELFSGRTPRLIRWCCTFLTLEFWRGGYFNMQLGLHLNNFTSSLCSIIAVALVRYSLLDLMFVSIANLDCLILPFSNCKCDTFSSSALILTISFSWRLNVYWLDVGQRVHFPRQF